MLDWVESWRGWWCGVFGLFCCVLVGPQVGCLIAVCFSEMSESEEEQQRDRTTSLVKMKSVKKNKWDKPNVQKHLSLLADVNFGDKG